jgi:ABC-type antimicrobial peptide transport system permease subunit
MALGASRTRVLRMVLIQSAIQVAIGCVVGAGLTLAVAALAGAGIQSVLFGVDPTDPGVYTVVIGLVGLVAFLATAGPARRATRVDPIVALRAE